MSTGALAMETRADGVSFRVRVTPRAATSMVGGVQDGVLQLRIAAPPVEGKANEALRELLARTLGVRAAAVQILRGDSSRHKLVSVRGISREDVLRALDVTDS